MMKLRSYCPPPPGHTRWGSSTVQQLNEASALALIRPAHGRTPERPQWHLPRRYSTSWRDRPQPPRPNRPLDRRPECAAPRALTDETASAPSVEVKRDQGPAVAGIRKAGSSPTPGVRAPRFALDLTNGSTYPLRDRVTGCTPPPCSSELDESSASGGQRDIRPAAMRRCSPTLQWCCVCFAIHTRCVAHLVPSALRLHTSALHATVLVGLQRLPALRSESLGIAEIRGVLARRDSFHLVGRCSRSSRGEYELAVAALPGSGDQGAPTNVYCGSSVAALRPSAMSSSSGKGGVRNPASTARCATLSNLRIAVLAALARVSVAISA